MSASRQPTVGQMIPRFLASREARGLRHMTMVNYRVWASWMRRNWAARLVHHVSADDIVGLCRTKCRNHAMVTQCFFRWLISQRLLPRGFDVGVLPLPPRTDEREISYLSPAQARRFLAAVRPQFRAAFALALYAGLRPYECCRIEWPSVHWRGRGEDRWIKVEARVSKIRRPRIIDGVPVILWRSLRPLAKAPGPVMPAHSVAHAVFRWISERQRAAKLARVKISHDVLRHTFATHFVALTGHPAMAAKVLGHYRLQTLAAHYDGVVTRSQARDYFGLPRRK